MFTMDNLFFQGLGICLKGNIKCWPAPARLLNTPNIEEPTQS